MRYFFFVFILFLTLPVKALELYSGVPFYDAKNNPISLESFVDKPILLFAWKAKCASCLSMLPKLDNFYLKHGFNIKILPVMINNPTLATARKIYINNDIKHLPVYMDTTGDFAEKARINSTPTIIIYDKKGNSVFQNKGLFDFSDADFETNLNSLINE